MSKTSKYFAKKHRLQSQKAATVATLAATAAVAAVSPFVAESLTHTTMLSSRSSMRQRQSNSARAIPAVSPSSSSLADEAGSDHVSSCSESTKSTTPTKRKRATRKKTSTAKKKLKTKAATSSSPPPLQKQQQTPRTESFSAIWAGSSIFQADDESLCNIKPHTLILGTHPSITSLERQRYFGHNMNAFWWIAGDCLGFRRDSGISPSTGKPYQFTSFLRHNNILSYEEQVRCFVQKGFCLWDVVASCQRPGSSLDQDIREEVPNRIREFCQQQQPSIQRIVLANGGTSATLMKKHFRDWFLSGELVAGSNPESQKQFGSLIAKANNDNNNNKSVSNKNKNNNDEEEEEESQCHQRQKIEIISAISVSPAAAKFTYEQKRDFWEEFVYKPGLMLENAKAANEL